ncbi:MAG: VOC family protein [Acidimicrobiia bacterium]|nr:VOC family protein [Acidimicrobiia bacterium]NND14090.1 VOC family protein [Acidimicrobiia bacterium]
MLADYDIGASLPASDINRARAFYRDKLDLKPVDETPDGGMMFETGSSRFLVYPSVYAGTNKATAAAWEVTDIGSIVSELRSRGVTFQEYDFDEIKTVDGIASLPDGNRAAWFYDSEDNILGLFQRP